MKNLPLLFCGILIALAFSFTGLVLSSYIQLGSLTQTTETLDESVIPLLAILCILPRCPGRHSRVSSLYRARLCLLPHAASASCRLRCGC